MYLKVAVKFNSSFYTLQLSTGTFGILMSCAAFIVSVCLCILFSFVCLHVCVDDFTEEKKAECGFSAQLFSTATQLTSDLSYDFL